MQGLYIYGKYEGLLCSTHYLKDGIIDIAYKLVDDKLVLTDTILTEDFDCRDLDASRHYPYNARILDIDWLE